MVDEAHITTFGVHPEWRRQGSGAAAARLADLGSSCGAARMTLEVRVGNHAAQELYRRFGFNVAGRRARYYTDDGEDAFVMTTPALAGPGCRRHRRRAGATEGRLDERAAGPGHRDQLRRDRRGGRRGRPPHRGEPGRHPDRAARRDRRDRARGGRAAAAALDRARPCAAAMRRPAVDWGDLDAVAVTYGPGLIGSLLVGVNVREALAVAHDLPLVGVNHIEGHIYANWLTDASAGEPLPAEPPFPAALPGRERRAYAAGADGRPRPVSPPGARPSTTRRARRSTRSDGCSACRTPAARRSAPPRRERTPATRFPRARTDGRTTSASPA